ncbi:DUF397 domain-containing protein [Kineosporia babensis]|uniref:DUF397 domain-containing protein n=1 Tax=Kineosporia babensis TaxID=499548 RepID=A0A9X1SYT3_9ACTN|nr:DUF397 domain-containing protein [Kineosporia babensis]
MKSTDWIKSRTSQATGNCIEMRRWDSKVEVRDSKNPFRPLPAADPEAIGVWLMGAKRGEYDQMSVLPEDRSSDPGSTVPH